MKIEAKNPPREYACGFEVKRTIRDCGSIDLEPDEQITLRTPAGGEYDVTRKSFGFYATPSTNSRLSRFGLRTAIARNRLGHAFVLLVESGRELELEAYLLEERMEIACWLDTDANVKEFLERMAG